MKKYRVKVNGKVYEVELEEVEVNEEKIEVKKEAKQPTEGKTINAPIGGKILSIKVATNQQVKKGDLVCVIEAMKMENEVLSTVDGKVKEVLVTTGAQVENKEPLVVIE